MARQKGYPMQVLRLALAAYRMPRSVGADGVYSRMVHATRGITAGSGTATVELSLLILQLLDILDVECPNVSAAVYVDDINLEATDDVDMKDAPTTATTAEYNAMKGTELAATLAKAVNTVITYFDEGLNMDVSAAKSVYTASI